MSATENNATSTTRRPKRKQRIAPNQAGGRSSFSGAATTTSAAATAAADDSDAEQRDVPGVDEPRRPRAVYYTMPPTDSDGMKMKPMQQVLAREDFRKSSKPASSSRKPSLRSSRKGTSKASSTKIKRTVGETEDIEYVYEDASGRQRSRSGRTSKSAAYNVVQVSTYPEEEELEPPSSEDENLRSATPPPAPDPPKLTDADMREGARKEEERVRKEMSRSVSVKSTKSTAKSSRSAKSGKSTRITRSSRSQRSSAHSSRSSSQYATNKIKRRNSEPPLPAVVEVEEPPPSYREDTPIADASFADGRSRRRASMFGAIFTVRSKPRTATTVECLTCASGKSVDRTAMLACGHVMCHSCLKHLFTMSLTDPQHMPPKCCTPEHIPLKYVAKLFDKQFKERWNKKYLEYTTSNRLYCPSRGCGTWIAPQHIHPSSVDPKRSIGICPKCSRKTCASCGRKWHTTSDCEARNTDTGAKEFAKMAQDSGWKRCYNCTATVELREGCNHMTCRCGAQFCMICGIKWKGCDCPWFNYQAVADPDRFLEGAARILEAAAGTGAGRAVPAGYAAEMQRRQDQERRDEDMARRMQGLELDGGLGNDDDGGGGERSRTPTMERDWGGNDTFGFGRMSGHFLNDDFVIRATRILTSTVNRQNRAAADRLIAEIRGDRAPPLPGTAFLGPHAGQYVTPAGQEDGIIETVGDGATGNCPSRRKSKDRNGGGGAGGSSSRRKSTRSSTSRRSSEAGTRDGQGGDSRRRSVLAGLATSPDHRVHQWVQHVDEGVEE